MLVLAAALRIPPIALLCPGLPDGEAEMLPGWHATAAAAMTWVTGEMVDEDDEDPPAEVRSVALTRRRSDAQRSVERLRDGMDLLSLGMEGEAKVVKRALQAAEIGGEIADLNRQIADIPRAVVTELKGKK